MGHPPRARLTFRVDRKAFNAAVHFARRFRKDPEAVQGVLALAKEKGAKDEDLAAIVRVLTAMRNATLDTETTYHIDQYLLTGVGALDLVMIPTILPLGVSYQVVVSGCRM